MCADAKCDEGVTACPGCHGWGVVNPKGKPYRWARSTPIPSWAVTHDECKGMGVVVCGCVPLDEQTVAILARVDGKAEPALPPAPVFPVAAQYPQLFRSAG